MLECITSYGVNKSDYVSNLLDFAIKLFMQDRLLAVLKCRDHHSSYAQHVFILYTCRLLQCQKQPELLPIHDPMFVLL